MFTKLGAGRVWTRTSHLSSLCYSWVPATETALPRSSEPPLSSYQALSTIFMCIRGFSDGSAGKETACNAGDVSLIPGLGRSLEEGMATHASILVWKIPRTAKAFGLQSMGLQRVRHDWTQAPLGVLTDLTLSTILRGKSCYDHSHHFTWRNKSA